MLTLVIPETEIWDEKNMCFIYVNKTKLKMEHSLLSLSKWEEKYEKPFLDNNKKTKEEELDYYKFMTTNPNVDDNVFQALTPEDLKVLDEYINKKKHTATRVPESKKPSNNSQFVTSELIYYWMLEAGIPYECEKWNLQRLLTLLQVVSNERGPKKKMTQEEVVADYAALNKIRRAKLKTKG